MKADPAGVLTGAHYLDGDFACGEGAMAAGCRFVAGYPITPSTEVVERISRRFPMMGGIFIQMEDELASMAAVVGASWTGTKSMTVTSGPGFSLMMENIGLGAMMEAPCVVVNVQRGGPSTGLPTMVGQADIMQARWGSHGDYELIALSPQSPQEAFDLTIDAFNLSEIYRVPVMFMMDECVGHMTEKVVIPPAEEIEVVPRKLSKLKPEEYWPYSVNGGDIPEMVRAGDGYRFHTTGLTHDHRGYPDMSAECQELCVRRLVEKIKHNADKIVRFEEEETDGADVVVVTYGITARVARMGIEMARKKGVKVGVIRLIVIWPFPEKRIRELAGMVKAFVVPEINYGQIVLEVERCAAGKAAAVPVSHGGGGVHDPNDVCQAILGAAK
ncbi:MAG: 2-oxoacid:acceptor oxidoreductase subunit alpha [Candidatus Latescibacteria bacterium]|nr:2-oxoacid:acceptor oxidoreductase subunit alpha [Candidatus Latescibacterota bacterium]NIM66339.1 2-oxoacid:acceptor oxidoreductase subunit alpha [Candidatus Latescibacterota bacterium]NIO02818.1 2-oxoacid:acceptor oxidoreductase subunit alpha [Candidatus Latescibacterota bacterium]NIO29953.1 2-oxoacid:acceptor oxidoreductase subunit alpha [Candidatus Latescibacterota bacterium]NIO57568.1 2-oxoacid:acceptor oxidoreductase subunit alpha [Candidatus Latescibacterota bacterium]